MLGDTQAHTIQKTQQAFGDDAVGKLRSRSRATSSDRAAPQWIARHAQVGQPTSRKKEPIEKVLWIIMKYRRVTIQETAHEVEICTWSVHSVLMRDLRMRAMSVKCDRSFRPLIPLSHSARSFSSLNPHAHSARSFRTLIPLSHSARSFHPLIPLFYSARSFRSFIQLSSFMLAWTRTTRLINVSYLFFLIKKSKVR